MVGTSMHQVTHTGALQPRMSVKSERNDASDTLAAVMRAVARSIAGPTATRMSAHIRSQTPAWCLLVRMSQASTPAACAQLQV